MAAHGLAHAPRAHAPSMERMLLAVVLTSVLAVGASIRFAADDASTSAPQPTPIAGQPQATYEAGAVDGGHPAGQGRIGRSRIPASGALTAPSMPRGHGALLPYLDVIGGRASASMPRDRSVVVAVVDSGVDITHPDLAGRIWENPRSLSDGSTGAVCPGDRHGCSFVSALTADPSCGYRSTSPTGAITDDNGHGTFVAGIVIDAARAIEGADVQIMPVKVLDCTGEGRASQAAAGIRYAARAGARVIVLSFSGTVDIPSLRDAVEEARVHFGALVVASAGNDGGAQTQYPSGYPGVLGVGGTGILRADGQIDYLRLAPFSNVSEAVSLLAPAVRIMGPVPSNLCGRRDWTCVDGEPYAFASGTSYATPLVAGAAALLFAYAPSMTPDDVLHRLVDTARPIPGSLVGQVDVSAALEAYQ